MIFIKLRLRWKESFYFDSHKNAQDILKYLQIGLEKLSEPALG